MKECRACGLTHFDADEHELEAAIKRQESSVGTKVGSASELYYLQEAAKNRLDHKPIDDRAKAVINKIMR